ncbi:MAG: DpnD/PcfM family protein [Bacteroidota bacterium]|nr:DpnD/PcfM family protein [Bacteroidota bacterium]
METFKIEIQEFLARVVEIESESLQEAFTEVQNKYRNSDIVLDANDFVEVDFIDINAQSKNHEIKMLTKEVVEYLFENEKKHYEESENPQNHIFLKLERLKFILD